MTSMWLALILNSGIQETRERASLLPERQMQNDWREPRSPRRIANDHRAGITSFVLDRRSVRSDGCRFRQDDSFRQSDQVSFG